jgi:ABC-type branched-subunit amino acid transport system substrate-binding protein
MWTMTHHPVPRPIRVACRFHRIGWLATGLLAAAAAGPAGCGESDGGSSAGGTRTVIIGAVIDRTGSQAWPGWIEAIRLAEAHANQALEEASYKGLKFRVVMTDSENDPAVALPRAIDLATKQKAKAIITDSSQNDVAINRTFYDDDASNDLGVPVQCSACTSGSINNPGATDADPITQATYRNEKRWNFRSTMATKLMAPVVVRLLTGGTNLGDVNGDGQIKLAVYASDESFGRATASDLKAALMQQNPAATFVQRMHPRDADPYNYDWKGDLTALNADKPDAIVVATFPQLHGAIVKVDSQAPGARLFHFHNMRNQRAIQLSGTAGDKQEGISHVLLNQGNSGETFKREFEAAGGSPVAFRDAVFYDSAMTIMLAALVASKDLADPSAITGAQLRDALVRTSEAGGEVVGAGSGEFAKAITHLRAGRPFNYDGASGPMDYDANLNVRNRIAHFRVEGGRTLDLATFDCVSSDACPTAP